MYTDGDKYDGDFKDNLASGYGKYYHANGATF